MSETWWRGAAIYQVYLRIFAGKSRKRRVSPQTQNCHDFWFEIEQPLETSDDIWVAPARTEKDDRSLPHLRLGDSKRR